MARIKLRSKIQESIVNSYLFRITKYVIPWVNLVVLLAILLKVFNVIHY